MFRTGGMLKSKASVLAGYPAGDTIWPSIASDHFGGDSWSQRAAQARRPLSVVAWNGADSTVEQSTLGLASAT
jgi:hypothetical protein